MFGDAGADLVSGDAGGLLGVALGLGEGHADPGLGCRCGGFEGFQGGDQLDSGGVLDSRAVAVEQCEVGDELLDLVLGDLGVGHDSLYRTSMLIASWFAHEIVGVRRGNSGAANPV